MFVFWIGKNSGYVSHVELETEEFTVQKSVVETDLNGKGIVH